MLNKYLQDLRKFKGYTQEEVARAIGLTRPTYVAVEQGKRDLTTKEAELVAHFFGLSLVDFITEKRLDYDITVTAAPPKQDNHLNPIRISIPADKLAKFRQVLLYILHREGGKPNVGMAVLYKLLYFIDFDYYEKYEEQLMGLTYIKNHHGPTPNVFAKTIENLVGSGDIEAVKSKFYKYDQTKYLINPTISLDLFAHGQRALTH
jgi:transcriptional regulator with XRE-family HTH domain